MFDQTETLVRLLDAFDTWPADELLRGHDREETLELVTYTAHTLDPRHLLALLWLASHLYIHQGRQC